MLCRALALILLLAIEFLAGHSTAIAATKPAAPVIVESCPNAVTVASLVVNTRSPQVYDPRALASNGAIGKALVNNGMPIAILTRQDVAPTDATSFESAAISGLYSFLVDRAKLEAEAYAVDLLNTQLCGVPARAPYFPNTCQAFTAFQAGTGDDSAATLSGLQRSLEQDVRYLPACLLKRPPDKTAGTVAGYLIFDAIKQLTSGAKVSTGDVVYGLVTDPHFAAECRASYTGAPTAAALATRPCRIFEATTAVAAAMELTAIQGRSKNSDSINFATLYLYDLALFSCTTAQPNENATIAACGDYAKTVYTAFLHPRMSGDGLKSLIKTITTITAAVDGIATISTELKTAADTLQAQQPKTSDAQETVVQLLVSLGEQIGAAISATSCLHVNSANDCGVNGLPPADATLAWAGNALQAYAYISAKQYVEAIPYALQVVTIADDSAIPKQYMAFIAEIAEAKTSADFEKALNAVASPVGAWRQKKTSAMWSVNSFVGGQAGRETLTGAGVSAASSLYYGAYVPLGFARSWPVFSSGYAGIYVQALDLGVLASDHANRNQANSGSNGGVARVLAPGVGLFVNPAWIGPVTFGLGYVFRSPGLRDTKLANGQSVDLDSRRVMFTVGVDVTVLKLSH